LLLISACGGGGGGNDSDGKTGDLSVSLTDTKLPHCGLLSRAFQNIMV
jgi:hypothetical protein